MNTILSTLEDRWQEVGTEGVKPALGSPEYFVGLVEKYVREGLLNVYRYEIDKRHAQRRELKRFEQKVKRADWDPRGGPEHRHLMAVICWHVENELGCKSIIGKEYTTVGKYYDVADSRCILPFEAGEYGDKTKLKTLFQAGDFTRAEKYNKPAPNGVGRVAFVPFPDDKSTVKKSTVIHPVFVFTKEWMTRL